MYDLNFWKYTNALIEKMSIYLYVKTNCSVSKVVGQNKNVALTSINYKKLYILETAEGKEQ